MLSLDVLRDRTDEVRRACAVRGMTVPLDHILQLDEQRRGLLAQVEGMRADRNQAGKEIGAATDAEQRQRMIEEQRALASELDGLEHGLREVEAELNPLLLEVPNVCHEEVPEGEYADGVIVIEGDGVSGQERHVDPPRRLGDEPPDAVEDGAKAH